MKRRNFILAAPAVLVTANPTTLYANPGLFFRFFVRMFLRPKRIRRRTTAGSSYRNGFSGGSGQVAQTNHNLPPVGFLPLPRNFLRNQAIKFVRDTVLDDIRSSKAQHVALASPNSYFVSPDGHSETELFQQLVVSCKSSSDYYQNVEFNIEIRHTGLYERHANNDDIAHDLFRKRLFGGTYSVAPRDTLEITLDMPNFRFDGPYRVYPSAKNISFAGEGAWFDFSDEKIFVIDKRDVLV